MSVTGTCISFCIIRFEHYQPTRFRLVFSCTLSFFSVYGHRDFLGADCYWHYKKSSDKDKKTMCDIFTKFTECCKIIEHPRKKKNKGGKKHRCVVTRCPVCQDDVDIRTYKCFIQPAKEEEWPRRFKEERNARIKRLQRQGIPMSAMDPSKIHSSLSMLITKRCNQLMVNIDLLWYVAKAIRRTIHMYFMANIVLKTSQHF